MAIYKEIFICLRYPTLNMLYIICMTSLLKTCRVNSIIYNKLFNKLKILNYFGIILNKSGIKLHTIFETNLSKILGLN